MHALAKNWLNTALLGSSLLLSGCNLGFVSFETSGPENFSSADGRPFLAKNLSLSGPGLAEAGVCTAITIEAQANDGVAHPVPSAVTISLSLASGVGAKFYADSTACENDTGSSIFGTLSSTTLAAGQSRVTFYVRSLGDDPFTVVAVSEELGFNSLPLNVRAVPSRVVFTQAADYINGGRCEGRNRFRLEVQDGLGRPVPGSNLSVNLSSLVPGKFSLGCGGAPIDALTFSVASRDVYFETASLQQNGIRATAPSLDTEAVHPLLINPTADSISLSRPSQSEDLGECSAEPLLIEVRDSEGGSFSPPLGLPLRVTASVGSARFYESQAACLADTNLNGGATTLNTTVIGAAQKAIYFRATHLVAASGSAQRNLNLRIRVRSVSDPHISEKSEDVSIQRLPKRLTLSGPTAVSAGICSGAFTATIRDRMGRAFLSSGETVNLTEGGLGLYYGQPGCGGGATSTLSFGAAATAQFYYKNDSIQQDIVVRVGSASVSSAEMEIDSNPAAVAVRLTSAVSGSVPLGDCVAYTVETLDANGDLVVGDAKDIEITLPVPGHRARAFTTSSQCNSDPRSQTARREVDLSQVNGSSTFYVRATALPSVTLQAKFSGEAAFDQLSKSVVQTATSLVLAPSGSVSLTVGLCHPVAFTVSLLDGVDQPFSNHSGMTIGLNNPGDGDYFSDGDCQTGLTGNQLSIGAGSASADFFIHPTAARSAFGLEATTAGLPASNSVSVTYQVVPFALHTDFAGSGFQERNLTDFSSDQGVDLIQLSDSRILAVGVSNDAGSNAIGLVKLNAQGDLDVTFAGGGRTRVEGTSGELLGAVPVAAVRGTGHFWVAATLLDQMILARFDNSGALDTGFNGTGFVTSSFIGQVEAVALVDTGASLVVVGTLTDGGNQDFAFMEVDAAGSVLSEVDVPFSSSLNSATSAAFDGTHLAIAGSHDGGSGEVDGVVARVSLNGLLDLGFNGQGYLVLDQDPGRDERITDLGVDGAAYVLAGTVDNGRDALVQKVDANGVSPGFNSAVFNLNQDGLEPRLTADPLSSDWVLALRQSDTLRLVRLQDDGTQTATRLFSALGSPTPASLLAVANGQFYTLGTSGSGTALVLSRHLK